MAIPARKHRKRVISVRILGLEIRRVLKTKITLILLAAAMGLTFVMAYLPVTYVYTSYVDAQGNVIEVKGKDAIAYEKQVQKDIAGEIEDEDVQKAIQQCQKCLATYGVTDTYELPKGVYGTEILSYAPLLHGVREAFADPDTGIAPAITNIPVGEVAEFYSVCEKRLESLMKMEQEDYPKAQQKAIEMYEQVEKPYVFYPGYNKDAMDYQVLLSFLVMVICVVITAPIFSSDYQTEADAILRCTKHGRMKLATTKIVSALLISGMIYTICIGTYIIVSNSLFGWECTETSVQMLYSVISLVNMNLGKLQIWVAVAGLISVLATVALTLLLSARFKNVVVSLAMSLMVCILPIIIYIALPTQIATWINAFTPSSGVGLMTSILYLLVDFIFLNVGNVSVWLPYVMIGAGIIEIPVFILGAVRNYIVYSK